MAFQWATIDLIGPSMMIWSKTIHFSKIHQQDCSRAKCIVEETLCSAVHEQLLCQTSEHHKRHSPRHWDSGKLLGHLHLWRFHPPACKVVQIGCSNQYTTSDLEHREDRHHQIYTSPDIANLSRNLRQNQLDTVLTMFGQRKFLLNYF